MQKAVAIVAFIEVREEYRNEVEMALRRAVAATLLKPVVSNTRYISTLKSRIASS